MSNSVVISGTGLWIPENTITNEELVDAYNAYADKFNAENKLAIASSETKEMPHSNAAFIEKASGIKSRYAYCKDGILNIERMRPYIPKRADNELSVQAEIAVKAAEQALKAANKTTEDIDVVIVSCAYTQRSYPAIAIEVQHALGIDGFGFDMLVACSAGTFALHRAYEMIKAETAKTVLVINPELTSPQVNYCDRDSHFIFGDVSVASVIENASTATSNHIYDVLGVKAATVYSNNIRSNFGYTSRTDDTNPFDADALFRQNGQKVFKEVCPMAATHIREHLHQHGLTTDNLKRWWLHQANINMNLLISKRLLGRDATLEEAPIILDRFANTASAGSLIAFNLYHEDLVSGDIGVICSFGAGYSIGSLVVKKL